MIRFSHEHRAIYCHIPRCGGTSMDVALKDWSKISYNRFGIDNLKNRFVGSGQFIYEYLPDFYIDIPLFFVFTTIRNPYDRYASGLQLLRFTRNRQDYIAHWKRNPICKKYWIHEHIKATQKATLGELKPDYIMRLENIEEDFKLIRDMFGINTKLPKLNSYGKVELDDAQVRWVNEHYAEDFDTFGYERR